MSYLPKPFHLESEPGTSRPATHRSETNVRLRTLWLVILHLLVFAGALLQRSHGCIRRQVHVMWKNFWIDQVAPKTFTLTFGRASSQLLLLSSGIYGFLVVLQLANSSMFQTFKWKTHLVRHKQTVHANLSKNNKGNVRKTEKINEGKFV